MIYMIYQNNITLLIVNYINKCYNLFMNTIITHVMIDHSLSSHGICPTANPAQCYP